MYALTVEAFDLRVDTLRSSAAAPLSNSWPRKRLTVMWYARRVLQLSRGDLSCVQRNSAGGDWRAYPELERQPPAPELVVVIIEDALCFGCGLHAELVQPALKCESVTRDGVTRFGRHLGTRRVRRRGGSSARATAAPGSEISMVVKGVRSGGLEPPRG